MEYNLITAVHEKNNYFSLDFLYTDGGFVLFKSTLDAKLFLTGHNQDKTSGYGLWTGIAAKWIVSISLENMLLKMNIITDAPKFIVIGRYTSENKDEVKDWVDKVNQFLKEHGNE